MTLPPTTKISAICSSGSALGRNTAEGKVHSAPAPKRTNREHRFPAFGRARLRVALVRTLQARCARQ
jgi:hypothetical protein